MQISCRIFVSPKQTNKHHSKMTTAKKIKLNYNLRNGVDIFSNRDAAFRWAENCHKLHVVILGENEKFWIVSFADGQRLAKLGFELAA